MNIGRLTFVVTDDCNFRCRYCSQEKNGTRITHPIIRNALEFFSPFFMEDLVMNFYGGEPLLAYDYIRYAVEMTRELIGNRNIECTFGISTNGSLLNDDILAFFDEHRFSVLLSFDGLAQDLNRQPGSFDQMVKILKRIQDFPGIYLETNSVFNPQSVSMLSESMRFMVEQGSTAAMVDVSSIDPWSASEIASFEEQFEQLREYLVSYYKTHRVIPVSNFQENKRTRLFGCGAGSGRMAIAPDGKLWGCPLFYDYFKGKENTPDYRKYFFGDLDTFIAHHETIHPNILLHYEELNQDYFCTDHGYCFMCDELEECATCPIFAAQASSELGKIPSRVCELTKIRRRVIKEFYQDIAPIKSIPMDN
ncbi:MAG: radical SAM protein [Candidatus Omnitrophota bacterium]